MWPETISEEQWSVYQRVIAASRAAGLRFAIGGGIAVGVYTDNWRVSKDIDFYILKEDREILKRILSEAGLVDYYDQLAYDREWIYRSVQGKIETFRIVPPEEMIWAKLYVMQKDRTDWPDVLNILYAQRKTLNWRHLLDRLGEDAPLLYGLLTIFRWLCPNLAAEAPAWLWRDSEKAQATKPVALETCRQRADLLDRRSWFKPLITT